MRVGYAIKHQHKVILLLRKRGDEIINTYLLKTAGTFSRPSEIKYSTTVINAWSHAVKLITAYLLYGNLACTLSPELKLVKSLSTRAHKIESGSRRSLLKAFLNRMITVNSFTHD